jgi:hypothetical protein
MNTNILDKIIAKGGVIRPGVYLQTLEDIVSDQKSWDDSDPCKLMMFNYDYWVTTDDGQKPQGYDNDAQFVIDFPDECKLEEE